MDSKGTLSKQDFMQEKLAKWKAEKAQKNQNAANRKAATTRRSITIRPLKEATGVNRVRTATAEKTSESSNKRSSSQIVGSNSTQGSVRSKKDDKAQSHSPKKSPVKEMTMREKLDLWKAQRQPRNKKAPSMRTHSAMKTEGRSGTLAQVTPSSKTPLCPLTPGYKGLTAGEETIAGDTPKKHLFKTPTSVKGIALRLPANSSLPDHRSTTADHQSTTPDHQSTTPDHQSTTPDHQSTTPDHQSTTPSSNAGRGYSPATRPTQDEPPRKHKAVTFLRVATPTRRSPRQQRNTKSAGGGRSRPDGVATPKQPWQDKKLDMQQRLEQWLASKGKTPSRYSHLLNFKRTPADHLRRSMTTSRHAKPARAPPQVWRLDSEPSASFGSGASQEEDELTLALSSTMDECFSLLQSGCPTEHVSEWLDNLVDRVPAMRQCAKYWLCRVSIGQEEGRDANEIIHIYEEAVRECAQPIQEVKDSLQQYVTALVDPTPSAHSESVASPDVRTTTDPDPVIQTPRGSRYLAAVDQLLQSSVLRYCLTESTPYFNRAAIGHRPSAPMTPAMKLVTPVRRSTRLEGRRSVLPCGLQDHDPCLASLGDLPSTGPQEFILRTNRALEGEFLAETGHGLDLG